MNREVGRRTDAARPAPAFGLDEPLELAAVQEESAAILALLDHEAAALEGVHAPTALRTGHLRRGGHRGAPMRAWRGVGIRLPEICLGADFVVHVTAPVEARRRSPGPRG